MTLLIQNSCQALDCLKDKILSCTQNIGCSKRTWDSIPLFFIHGILYMALSLFFCQSCAFYGFKSYPRPPRKCCLYSPCSLVVITSWVVAVGFDAVTFPDPIEPLLRNELVIRGCSNRVVLGAALEKENKQKPKDPRFAPRPGHLQVMTNESFLMS